jgi:hypothetical protein
MPILTINQTNKGEHTMSKFQLETIQAVLGCDIKQAEELIQLMDETGDYPDWSEYSTKQFQNHFKMVLAGF